MSEKFSVEDILNEVKNMTGDRYVAGQPSGKNSETQKKEEKEASEVPFKKSQDFSEKKDDTPFKPETDKASSLPEDIDKNDETPEDIPDVSKMTAKELFERITQKAESNEDSGIVGGFKVKSELAEDAPKTDEQAENLEKTIVFDKKDIEKSIALAKSDDDQKKTNAENKVIEKEENQNNDNNKDDFSSDASSNPFKPKSIHTPDHLLSADEIKNGFSNETPSFRFSDRIKDLTKGAGKKEKSKKGFDDFMKPKEENDKAVDDLKENNNDFFKKPADEADEIPIEKEKAFEQSFESDTVKSGVAVVPEEKEEELSAKVETNASADELFDILSEKYTAKEKEDSQPDILNNEIEAQKSEKNESEKDEDAEKIPDSSFSYEKQVPDNAEKEIKSSSKSFLRKTSRRIFERQLDYSEEVNDEQDVIDDYTSIEDEEAVRYDLDLTVKRVTKRLALTVITFIIGFVITVLPKVGVDFLSVISPNENLTGFMVANAVVLAAALIINISGFLRGLGSLITLKPDADSPLSIASLFVIAGCVLAFIPEFSAEAGALPFYTAALIFAYVLNLMGKKAMAVRIRSNFRLVATTAVKQSGFAADDQMCEMLESEDFIGIPYVAASKSVLNLHNYLKNSYCEEPSDNISRSFAPIALVASLVTLIFTYFTSKDIMSAITYACAVAVTAAPASVILSVNSPLKKAALQFRQKDGLISGYSAVNEFSDVDCVAINAEELFPAGSVELTGLRAIGDVSIEDVILKSAALAIGAGGPLADVFDKIIDGRRKMLPEIKDIVYEDGLGLSGNVDGKIVRIGNRKLIDSYGIYGLSDTSVEEKANKNGAFVVYTAIEDEVCGMFALKYKSIDPDIEDAVYNLVSNGVSIAVKTNDQNITPELIEKVFEVPKEYISVMEAHTAEHFDEITRPAKNGDSLIAYGGNSSVFANIIIACKKLKSKITVAVILQAVLTILGFGLCMFIAVSAKGFENLSALNVIIYQLLVAVISVAVPSLIKRIK